MLLFFINFIILCFANSFKINVKNVIITTDEINNIVFVELDYMIKNKQEKPLFVYDNVKRNDMHYEIDNLSNKTIMKKIYVFKPSNLNSWYASSGYNPSYPSFISIKPGNIHRGVITLTYQIPKSINPYGLKYEFNFITTDYDVEKNRENLSKDEINEKYLQDTVMTFKIPKK